MRILLFQVPVPIPGSRARRPKYQHAVRDTDGSLLGGCGCNRDLRAKVLVFAAAHIHIHTTAQQLTICAYGNIQHFGWLKSSLKKNTALNFKHPAREYTFTRLIQLCLILNSSRLGIKLTKKTAYALLKGWEFSQNGDPSYKNERFSHKFWPHC